MALQNSYYVDSHSGDDSGDHNGYTDMENHAKLTLSPILDAIAANLPLTHDVYVYFKSGNSEPYTGDLCLQGLRAVGGDYKVIFLPYGTAWDSAKFAAGVADPLGGIHGFDPSQATFGVNLQMTLEVRDCPNIVFRGICFQGVTADSGLKLMARGDVTAQYCRFDGPGTGVLAMFNSIYQSENCYYSDCYVGVMALYDSHVHLSGNNYVNDPVVGAVHLGARSMLVVRAIPELPHLNTLAVTTTKPRIKDFAALKPTAGSTIIVQDESVLPQTSAANMTGFVNIHHAHPVLRKGQCGVVLDGQSMLIGAAQITCTKVNAQGDTVDASTSATIARRDTTSAVYD